MMNFKYSKHQDEPEDESGFEDKSLDATKTSHYGTIKEPDTDIDLEDITHQGSNIFRKLYPKNSSKVLKKIFGLSWPVIITNLLEYVIGTVSIVMCGHLNHTELDAASLANSIFSACGVSVALGMATACDTLFSQTFGSKHKKGVGIHVQRSSLILALLPFVIYALFLNIEPFLILIKQDPEVSRMTAEYMVYLCPALFFVAQYNILARYMQTQEHVYPPMIFGIIANTFNAVAQYIGIYVLGFDHRASAVCQSLTFFIMWLQALVYILVTKFYVPTWDGLTLQAFCGWKNFLKLGLPGIAMIFLEIFAWEVMTIVSGILGTVYLGAQAIMYQLQTIVYMIGFGIGEGISITVGNALGGGKPILAKIAFRIGVTMTFGYSIITCIIFLSATSYLPRIFTDDEQVIVECSKILPLLAIFQIMDGLSAATGGAIRGCGRQAPNSIIILVSYYIVALPIAFSLGFVAQIKLLGFWIGLLTGVIVHCTSMIVLISTQNWNNQARIAQERVANSVQRLGGAATSASIEESSSSIINNPRPAFKPRTNSVSSLVHSNKHIIHHARTASQVAISQATAEKLQRIVNTDGKMKIIGSKLLVFAAVTVWFLGGIFLKIYLPKDLYWPTNHTSHNVSMVDDTIWKS